MILSLLLAVAWAWCVRPALTETKCSEPPSMYIHHLVQGGDDYKDEFDVGTELRYECGPGYFPRDIKTWKATCVMRNGSPDWEIEKNDCRPVSCGHPGEVRWGRLLDAVFAFPKRVRYECNHGYRLVGEANLYCQSDGRWSSPKPECHIVDCGGLEDIPNGRVTLSGTTFGSNAEFSCSRCFRVVGNSTRTCGADGKWTGASPHCEEVFCDPPQHPQPGGNSSIGPEDGRQRCETKIEYTCPAGTTLVGSNINSCFETGKWLFDTPTCVPDCTVPDSPNSAVLRTKSSYFRRQQEHVRPGEKFTEAEKNLVVQCREGFHLIDDGLRRRHYSQASLRCYQGHWDPRDPWCTEKSCTTSYLSVIGGKPLLSEVPHGHHVEFTCSSNHTLVQQGTPPTCQLGRVVGRLPFCKPDDCRLDKLPSVEHGKPLETQSVSNGSFAQYYCEQAFDLRNSGQLQCHWGSWKGRPPVCVKAHCTVPDSPNSAVLRTKSSYFRRQQERVRPGEKFTEAEKNLVVQCREGFHLIDERFRGRPDSQAPLRCYRGHWDPSDPWCSEKSCKTSDLSLIGRKPLLSEVPHGHRVEFTCSSNHKLIQQGTPPTCLQGRVVGRLPVCKPVLASHRQDGSCELPTRQDRFKAYRGHEHIRPRMLVPHGAELKFHCEPVGTSIFRGSRTSTCMNGNWTKVLPFCYDLEPNSIIIELKTDSHTGPGGIVYVEPDKEVELECRSALPAELRRNGQFIDGHYHARSEQRPLRATFKLTRNESTEIICRHIEENPGQSRSITVVARYRYNCTMLNPATSTLNIRRKNRETYEFSCRPPSVLQGRKLLHCLVYGEWDNEWPTCVLPSSPTSDPGNAFAVRVDSLTPTPPSQAPDHENGFPVRVDSRTPTPPSQANRRGCTVTPVADGHFVRDRRNGTPKKVETGKQLTHGTVAYLLCNTASAYKGVTCVNGTWQPHPACDGGTQPTGYEATAGNVNPALNAEGERELGTRLVSSQGTLPLSYGMSSGNLQPSRQALPVGRRIKEPVDGAVEHETGVEDKATAGNVNPTFIPEGERELGTALASSQGDQSSSSRCLSPDTCISTQDGANIPRNLNASGNDGANSFQRFTTSPEVPKHFPSGSTPAALKSVSQMATPLNRGEPDVPTAPPTDDEIVRDLKARTLESISTASSIISQPDEETYTEAPDTTTGYTDVGSTRPEGKIDLEDPIHGGAPAPSELTTAQPAESVNATSTEVTLPTFSDPAEATTTQFPRTAPAPRSNGCPLSGFYELVPEGVALTVHGDPETAPLNTTFSAHCYDPADLITGEGPVTCLQNGSWDVPASMKCIKGCANFETGPDGPAVEGRKNFYGLGDGITFSCQNGTELHPRIERMICLGDEQGWSEHRLPTCIPVQNKQVATKKPARTRQ